MDSPLVLQFGMYTFSRHFQLPTLGDRDLFLGLIARVLCDVLDLVHNVITFKDFSKDNVLAVEPAYERLVDVRVPNLWFTYLVMIVVMKNCEPLVFLPELAMLSRPFLVCFNLKFSSSNLFPYIDFPPVPSPFVKSPP